MSTPRDNEPTAFEQSHGGRYYIYRNTSCDVWSEWWIQTTFGKATSGPDAIYKAPNWNSVSRSSKAWESFDQVYYYSYLFLYYMCQLLTSIIV